MIKKFKEDKKRYGLWVAIKEWIYYFVDGKKTYSICLGAIGLNYYLTTLGIISLPVFVLSTEYFLLEIVKKYTKETEHGL